jgi:hypothetical protein
MKNFPNQRSSMLGLVRRTCDDAEDMDDFEGVYEPDPEQVKDWQGQERPSYNGEMKYVNLGPSKVRDRLEVETDPVEKELLRLAESYWQKAGGYSAGMEAGSVFRGDERVAIHARSMGELANSVNSASHVYVGDLGVGGIPKFGEPQEPSDYVDKGIIDWSELLAMGPLPQTDDWF